MKARIKRLADAAFGAFGTHLRKSPARSRGDAARDAGEISAAADAYREHLKSHPRDFPIWVQLGHMLKDSSRRVEADYAYGRALALRPRDPDVLYHYGSLKRASGFKEDAAVLFARCADIAMTPELAAAMTAGDMIELISDDHRRLIASTTARAMADRLHGLTLIESESVLALGDGRFLCTTNDPWFNFTPTGTADSALAGLRIVIRGDEPGKPPVGRLYLDFGDGFDHNDSLDIPPGAGDGAVDVTIPLAGFALIRSIRWDPDDKQNIVRIERVEYLASFDETQAFRRVREAYPPEIAIETEIDDARLRLRKGDLTSKDAMSITRFLASDLRISALEYEFWRRRWVDPTSADYDRIAVMTEEMPRRPTFSVVIPVYNTPIPLLIECLESLLSQTYPHFEVCLADDRSPDPRVFETLERYARRDPRIKVVRRKYNGHISAASNAAMALATGEFVVLMDHDDLIPDYCLFTVAHYINQYPEGQVFYSDEDKVTISGERFQPYFKGNFDPFLMYGHNMVSHLGVYRRDLLERIGGFRLGLEGSQDYDLLLRCMDVVGERAIIHIPHVLYHWRAIPGSTAVSADQKSYAIFAAQAAINAHFTRTDSPLLSILGYAAGNTAVARTRDLQTSISIIIPTRDGLSDLRSCIDSILRHDHRNTQILVVDNGSEDPATLEYLAGLTEAGMATVLSHPQPFNFSEINNRAAELATGDILCFLNNDTEVMSRDWLDRARVLLSLDQVGMVGARLLYPDGALQHFGVTTGTADHRVASHPHLGLPEGSGGYFSKARLMQQFSAVTAACMFVTREAFEAAGGFDSELKVAYNDVDLCLKVRQAGYRIVGDPDIVLIHKESRTRGADTDGAKAARLDAEAALMRSRWGEVLDHDPFYSPNHALHGQFGFAEPPRVPMPWRMEAKRFPKAGRASATRRRAAHA
jgi:GT2 family glycosyltransferase